MTAINEDWKAIPGYEGLYEISNLGRVKSLNYRGNGKEGFLNFSLTKDGYRKVDLYKKKKRKTYNIHQLVAIVFLDHKPEGLNLVVDHKNNNKSNNKADNLQIITQRRNASKDRVSKSHFIGVSFSHKSKIGDRWRALICVNGSRKHLGSYKNEYEAHLAYQEALKNIERNAIGSLKR